MSEAGQPDEETPAGDNADPASGQTPPWYQSRTLLLAWLLTFFPVGLYALWKGDVFPRNLKIGITVAVAVLFFIARINFTHFAYVFVLWPVALFLLWQDKAVLRKTLYLFGGAWIIVVLVAFYENAPVEGGGSFDDVGGSCSAVMTEGNCTYFRDSNCNVIARQCN